MRLFLHIKIFCANCRKRNSIKIALEAIEPLFCKHHPKNLMLEGGCDTNEILLQVQENLKTEFENRKFEI